MISDDGTILGRFTRCRIAEAPDAPFLRQLFLNPTVAPRFRWRGQTPSLEEFTRRASEGVLAQWIIEMRDRPAPIGVVIVSDPDFVNGTAFVSILADPLARGFGIMFDGAGAVIDYVFDTWPFRYLYSDVAEESLPQFLSAEGFVFEQDGFRREAMYQSGRYQNMHHLSISADRWRSEVRPVLEAGWRAGPSGPSLPEE